ncbi:respiratory-chain nadh dehydrogenase 51 kd subunit signature 2 [Lucifera butyrica]|uniref:Respiratory-chain nadh dehydrogenase 51 kd subunit signature 2 n=1 Tax=Lucifera butyrica TaxID=1351585 RepID=A0A498RDX1_9FIRM|nr:FAD-dependent oxidoreductase [Lucifera butyrica]VBB09694.1 respiratory-chain nadh dehydrogenase 51 kd subunit signature 2 [Lucifera butyrica]
MEFYRTHVLVCGGTGCMSSGCKEVGAALKNEIKRWGLDREIKVITTGCIGPCSLGPVVIVYPEGILYRKVQARDVPEIVEQHLLTGNIVTRLLYDAPGCDEQSRSYRHIPFFSKQVKIALRNTGMMNPASIEEYISRDGYAALAKALSEMTPAAVIAEVTKSGLRGRGGGGFPTGQKWAMTAKATGALKYVVCNADEGDPGAFMDRSVLEGDPHSVLEAMAIAGYATGAATGYIYVRAEYPLAIQLVTLAIGEARRYGLLGRNIFSTGFSFDIAVRVGAGAFVCGEETALLTSIEGKRGEPRPRPPYPANAGLWGKPTLINNVETFANIPPILLQGADWYRNIGTEASKGTKVFALAGKIKNTGIVEVPMGMPLGEIIYDIGGGIPNGKKFKAVQTGGPSGGCIPVEYLNTPVDYDSLKELGTIMGSGGFIILDEDTCMVDLAKYFLEFCQEESCGKCAPCRLGTKRMLEILERITQGNGELADIDRLLQLGEQIKQTALCGLGQTAPNAVLSTIRYFRDEYEAHIKDKCCPASVCAALFHAPCKNSCPAGVDVPLYIDHIRNQQFAAAVAVVKEQNPLPAICGRVCHHPCEAKCRRAQLDEAIAIRDLKRFAADYQLAHPEEADEPQAAAKEARVAIIGSGPAGLSAAYYLARQGYPVTIFEALPVAGGMLAVGIPYYRLPPYYLETEIAAITKLGVTIQLNTALGRDFTLPDLFAKGYKAVFLAIGAHKSLTAGLSGEDLAGVWQGIDFLRAINLGEPVAIGKKVAVIGGGNVAIDAARSALRLGAQEVHLLYRRHKEDMPAETEEIMAAEEEGIKIHELTAPLRLLGAEPAEITAAEDEGVRIHELTAPLQLLGQEGKLTQVECIRMRLGQFDHSGRKTPVPVEDSKYTIDVDQVIMAVGQTPDLSNIEEFSAARAVNGTIPLADAGRLLTGIPGVFAGGDCVTGPDTVIAAIATGHKAADAMDQYLGGSSAAFVPVRERKLSGPVLEERLPRQRPTFCSCSERIKGFAEVDQGLTADMAVKEAARCLRCDVRD